MSCVFSLELDQVEPLIQALSFELCKNFQNKFLENTSRKLLLEEPWILLQTAPTAIANNISKANYTKEFMLNVSWGQLWTDSKGMFRT